MNPQDLFNQVKELIEKKDFSAAVDFVNEQKDNLGEYFEQAKTLVEGAQGADSLLDKVKGLFGK
ncbi:adenylosuccinate synthetase [Streptococcus sp. S784/96/1]|uniref:adenylosuccinate synthetase n=1 Tax=Streptococcus sp. S784/96/1 TaxID=2653499 RepID=UPI00138A2F20|nr:adenylosuccinate synthetase [Streptococcus sp. S784/96/1]